MAIDFTAALERDILNVQEEEKITDFALLPFWELMVALGKFQGAINLESDVRDKISPDGHRVEGEVCWHNDRAVRSCGCDVGSHDGIHQGLAVDLLSTKRVVISHGAEVANVESSGQAE